MQTQTDTQSVCLCHTDTQTPVIEDITSANPCGGKKHAVVQVSSVPISLNNGSWQAY